LPLLAVAAGRRDLLANLRGHHAYCVVDAVTGSAVIGQDRFGEKPLLTVLGTASDEPVAFASTAPALAALGVRTEPTTEFLASWFRFGFAAALPATSTSGVKLAAAPRSTPTAWQRELPLAERLQSSVARCLDVTVPAALSLSGGLDSSCLAASVPNERRNKTPAYQFMAAGGDDAERRSARAVAEHCGLPFRPVDGGLAVLDALPELTRLAGAPLGDPSILAVHAVARAAAADGVRVLLGGEGADELFFGYRRYRALAHLPRLAALRALAPRWSQRYLARWMRAATSRSPAAALLAVTPPGFSAVLSPEIAAHPWWADAAPPPGASSALAATTPTSARDADLDGYLRWDLLPKADVAAMAAGLESRCPFLEGDFGIAPSEQALGKLALRRAFASQLPAAPLRLAKRGFALPLDRWFRGDCPWLDILRERTTLQRPHLRGDRVTDLVDRHRRGTADLGHAIYLVLALELHLRILHPVQHAHHHT
jgi:asparagine synthase (glutamine-hydrolysing)